MHNHRLNFTVILPVPLNTHWTRRLQRVIVALAVVLGGFFPLYIGWFFGVALVLVLPGYSARSKILAILAPPGGLLAVAIILGHGQGSACSGTVGHPLTCAVTAGLPLGLMWPLAVAATVAVMYTFAQLCQSPRSREGLGR